MNLLNTQRTADDVYLGYLQALAEIANATVKLQLSAGMRSDLGRSSPSQLLRRAVDRHGQDSISTPLLLKLV
ncbi:MAG: hypothetical protein ABSE05_15370 [Syntrophales bacterium]